MEYTLNRVWTLAALAALAAALALVLGFPMAAAGVAAGLPVGIVNYLMMFSVRRQMAAAGTGKADAGPLVQRSMLRLLLSATALLLASLLGPEFLIGALIGIVTEIFSYFKDAIQMFMALGRKE